MEVEDKKPIGHDENRLEPLGSRIRVLRYLRENPNTLHSPADIAKATNLEKETVESALKSIQYHPLFKEQKGEVGLFPLLRHTFVWSEFF